jgi:hypothetical protein
MTDMQCGVSPDDVPRRTGAYPGRRETWLSNMRLLLQRKLRRIFSNTSR